MKSGKHHIEAMAALLLFALFALCILAVLFSGVRVFSRLDSRDAAAFDRRGIEGYISTKLRQSDLSGGISIEDGVLILAAEQSYESRVYFHEGYLYEIFTRSDVETRPEDGEKLLPAESLVMSLENGLFRAEIVYDGRESEVLYVLRSGEEAAP